MTTREIIVDSFAGGGGASIGIEAATGRPVDVAINHNPAAIEMHKANHPKTRHYTESVWKANPRKVTGGRPVGLLWASPDCKGFSRAKGGKPVEKNIRSLAWVVVTWAKTVKPRVIILENVREFEEWGPLVPCWACSKCNWKGTEGQAKLARGGRRACPRCNSARVAKTDGQLPDPAKKGVTFKQFVGRLRAQGYEVQWRSLNAADFGAPTHRRRLFLVARCDGQPIVWPEPTHGDPAKMGDRGLFDADLAPWRTAAECIDWSLPCPSIFLTKEEGRKVGVKRPLAEKTLKRIALGVWRYVINNPRPFVVVNTSGNPPTGVDEPLKTVTTGNHHYLCTPFVSPVTHAGDRRCHPPTEPLPTVTGAHRGELAVATPFLSRISQTGGNGLYANDCRDPLTTIVSKAEHLLVCPTLVQTGYGERDGQAPRALNIEAPLGTVVAGGAKHALVSAFLSRFNSAKGNESRCHDPAEPLRTQDTQNRFAAVAANLVHLNRHTGPSGCDEPARTVTAGGNHAALVYSFLMKYHGQGGQWSKTNGPLHTIDCKDRMGLVTVTIEGQPYAIVDIGLRMLKPRELASCQGFPATTVLTGSAAHQVERIGNSVPPAVVEALVRANYVAVPEMASA